MTVELGTLTVRQLTEVSVHEEADLVRHRVPGADGELVQELGRPSVRVDFEGIVYGPDATARLDDLRAAFLARRPLDFYTEAVGEGYVTQVLIARLDVAQQAAHPGQLSLRCQVVEYVEPPEPPADPLQEIDGPLRGEAAAYLDAVQDTVGAVAGLTDLMAATPDLAVRTEPLEETVRRLTDLVGQGRPDLEATRDALDGDAGADD